MLFFKIMEIYTVLQNYFRIFENIIQEEQERWQAIIIKKI